MALPNSDLDTVKRRRVIQDIKKLPPAPFILRRVLDCIDNPRTCAADLKNVILEDQALTAKVLGFANSAYFGYSQSITEVTRAIVVVGFETILEMTVGLSVVDNFANVVKSSELDIKDFWKYSLSCGEATKIAAKHIGYEKMEQAYILGLVHDLGILTFLFCFGVEYDDILFECRAESSFVADAEKTAFSFDHTDAGQWLAEKWQLPEMMVKTIGYHHMESFKSVPVAQEIALVCLGEYIIRTLKIGSNGDISDPVLGPEVLSVLSLKESEVDQFFDVFEEERPKLDALFASVLQ